MAHVGQSFIYDLRKTLFEHLQKLSLGFYSRYSVGRVITRVINDVETLREFVPGRCFAIARDPVRAGGDCGGDALASIFQLSPITFATIPLMISATRLYRRTARGGLPAGARRHLVGQLGAGREHQRRGAWCRPSTGRPTTTASSANMPTATTCKWSCARHAWRPLSCRWWTCWARWQPPPWCGLAHRRSWREHFGGRAGGLRPLH